MGSYNVIIMVNWIHHIAPATLKEKLQEYFAHSLQINGRIIIDTVRDPEYEFNHDIHFLADSLNGRLEKIGDYERGREIWVIKK